MAATAIPVTVALPSGEFSDLEYELYVVILSKSKLKSSMRTSTLLAGFALVAMVEAEVASHTPPAILIPFAMHTALLTFVHLFSLMLATCLLPQLEALGSNPNPQLLSSALKIAKSFPVQLCWILSNVIGIVLFMVELVLVAYVKFYPTDDTPDNLHAGTGTLLLIGFLSVISIPVIVYYFRFFSKHTIQLHEQRLNVAQRMLQDINEQLPYAVPENLSQELYAAGSPQWTTHHSVV